MVGDRQRGSVRRAVVKVCRLAPIAALLALNPGEHGRAQLNGRSLEWSAPTGSNYERAAFRLWYPIAAKNIRAVVVLTPGANEDGRTLSADGDWEEFAVKNNVALVGCFFKDHPHEEMYIEYYAEARFGSGQALLDALDYFGNISEHLELRSAPLLLWGMSAGGAFNYEMVAWKPDRVLGFIVNKAGIYFSALLSADARKVPGLFFTGRNDQNSRREAVQGLFAINRRAGALWALIEEPSVGHAVGRSIEIARPFFDDLIARRLGSADRNGSTAPLPISAMSGYIGDPDTGRVRPAEARTINAGEQPTSWLLDERIGRVWQEVARARR